MPGTLPMESPCPACSAGLLVEVSEILGPAAPVALVIGLDHSVTLGLSTSLVLVRCPALVIVCNDMDSPSTQPSTVPSAQPSRRPSAQLYDRVSVHRPNLRQVLSFSPKHTRLKPTTVLSQQPSRQPSLRPSGQPLRKPSVQPSALPYSQPSAQPTFILSRQPTVLPSQLQQPFNQPSVVPSQQPSVLPASNRRLYHLWDYHLHNVTI